MFHMQDIFFPDSKTYSDEIPKLAHVSCSVTFEFSLITFLNSGKVPLISSPTQSTPLSSRIVDFESIIHSRNGDQCPQTCDLELASKSLHVRSRLLDIKSNTSPALENVSVLVEKVAVGWKKESAFATTLRERGTHCQPQGQELWFGKCLLV